MKFRDHPLAHKYLDGLRGIEIGASAHNPFNIPRCLNVDYTGDMTTVFKLKEVELCGEAARVDVVAEADRLPFADHSLDFVLSSHVFEHLPDPIHALEEWRRVTRPGGFLFLVVPNFDHPETFAGDRQRGLSTLERIDRDHAHRHTIKTYPDGDVSERGHYHLFTLATFEEFVRARFSGRLEVVEGEKVDGKVGNGFTSILRCV